MKDPAFKMILAYVLAAAILLAGVAIVAGC